MAGVFQAPRTFLVIFSSFWNFSFTLLFLSFTDFVVAFCLVVVSVALRLWVAARI